MYMIFEFFSIFSENNVKFRYYSTEGTRMDRKKIDLVESKRLDLNGPLEWSVDAGQDEINLIIKVLDFRLFFNFFRKKREILILLDITHHII